MLHRQRRILIISLVSIAGLLIVLYFSLSRIVLHYVNGVLEEGLHGYRGKIGDLNLALIKGGYQLEEVDIQRVEGNVAKPFFAASTVEFTLLWSALFKGKLAGEVEIESPVLILVHGDDETETQGGEEGDWLGVLRELTPFNLGRGEIRNGLVQFMMTFGDEERLIELSDLHILAENLANHRDIPGNLAGNVSGKGLLAGHAPVRANVSLDPASEIALLDFDLLIEQLDVLQLAPLTRSYANFEFEAGQGEIAAEIAVKGDEIRGYVKPILTNLTVARIEGDLEQDRDGLLLFTWENLVGLFSFILEDKEFDRFATLVPITGTVDSPDIDIFKAIGNAFKNAYGTAIESGLEHNTDLEDGFEADPEAYLEKLERAVDRQSESEAAEKQDEDDEPELIPHSQRRNPLP